MHSNSIENQLIPVCRCLLSSPEWSVGCCAHKLVVVCQCPCWHFDSQNRIACSLSWTWALASKVESCYFRGGGGGGGGRTNNNKKNAVKVSAPDVLHKHRGKPVSFKGRKMGFVSLMGVPCLIPVWFFISSLSWESLCVGLVKGLFYRNLWQIKPCFCAKDGIFWKAQWVFVFAVLKSIFKTVLFFFYIYLMLLSLPFRGTLLFSVFLIASQEIGLFSSLIKKLREVAVPRYRETRKHKLSQLLQRSYTVVLMQADRSREIKRCCWHIAHSSVLPGLFCMLTLIENAATSLSVWSLDVTWNCK